VNTKNKTLNTQNSISNIILCISALLLLFPIYWMIVCSFMSDAEIATTPPYFIPNRIYLDNYIQIFRQSPALRWLNNSIVSAGVTSFFVVIISTMAGYAFAKKKFYARNIIFYAMVFTMMIPKQILIVPLFKIVHQLNMFDSLWGIIIPSLGWPFGIFLMKQFLVTLPTELIQSAKIDGCSELKIFIHIVLPLAKPGIGALAIFTFITSWNDYMWQLLVISSKNLKTLPLGVASFQQEFDQKNALMIAGAVLASLPMVIVFLIFQKNFTKGITLGAVKG